MSEDMNEIARLEDERYGAIIRKDIAALQRLFHDDLIYMHSSGVFDTRTSYIEGIRDGVLDYKRVTREDQTMRVRDGVAFVFNRLTIDIVIRQAPKLLNTRALAVWLREGGQWRLIAVQSGAIPNP
jgi:ketosteroid isomerase-like protein